MSGTTWGPNKAAFSQLPGGLDVGMAASEEPGEHDIIGLNSSGYGLVLDGTDTNARVLGVHEEKRSTVSTTAGANKIRVWNGYGARMPVSSDANDSFASTDWMLPAYVSGAKEIGKLASESGVGRPLAGLFLGLDRDGDPILWLGNIAQLLARGLVMAESVPFAEYPISDAAASAAISERVIGYVTRHGVVTAATFGGAAVAADNTDYATGTIAKRVPTDSYAAATTIATFDTRSSGTGAVTAFTPYALSLSGTAANLRLIPGTLITLTTVKGGSGKALSGAFALTGKVI